MFPLFNPIKLYIHYLKTKPAQTKIISGGIIVALGDVVAQKFIEKKKPGEIKPHDYQRTARLLLVGLFLVAPWNYTWLDKILPKVKLFKTNKTKHALTKVFLDQTIAAPIAVSLYIGGNSALQNKDSLKAVTERVPATIPFFWKFWLPWQFINFRFVPQAFNMPTVQVGNFIWCSFLSWLDNNRDKIN